MHFTAYKEIAENEKTNFVFFRLFFACSSLSGGCFCFSLLYTILFKNANHCILLHMKRLPKMRKQISPFPYPFLLVFLFRVVAFLLLMLCHLKNVNVLLLGGICPCLAKRNLILLFPAPLFYAFAFGDLPVCCFCVACRMLTFLVLFSPGATQPLLCRLFFSLFAWGSHLAHLLYHKAVYVVKIGANTAAWCWFSALPL